MIDFAIVGLGSWGLCVLERTVSRARQTGTSIRVHVIEPGQLGGGVYATGQPDYLVLNNACGQLSLYASPDLERSPSYAIGLHEWAVAQGYRWFDHECRRAPGGVAIAPTDYLPRRLMGEYLVWCYDNLVADAPPNLEIVRHVAAATDIAPQLGGREAITLDNGQTVVVDHVVLTSGHTYNDEAAADPGGMRYLRPYPVEFFDDALPTGTPVAIAGMGLVGFDMLTALTIGRGGTFTGEGGDRKRYVRSGREPLIYLYSRSGVPYCAKSAHGVDPTGDYRPVVCTPAEFSRLTNPGGSAVRRKVDFRNDLLPLLYAEMRARYHTHAAFLANGSDGAVAERERLRAGWVDGHYDKAVTEAEGRYGRFDPADYVFAGAGRHYTSSRDYQSQVYDMVEDDLDEALTVGGSPVKAAQEVLRILRDQLRSVIEFGGLTLESYIDFQSNVRGRINRLEAGPPPMRSQQLLALVDAGVVHIPFGPNPDVSATADGRVVVRSTQLDRMSAVTMSGVVRGHLDLPSLARSASPMLKRLYAKGRLTQLSYGDTAVGSVAISENFHPYDAEGRLQPHLSLLGVLTEGVRYFTHYLPSPRSRMRAVLDAQDCVESIIG
jgi:FAD-NAD(P)-binding